MPTNLFANVPGTVKLEASAIQDRLNGCERRGYVERMPSDQNKEIFE